ncbi:MAG: Gfo/Idh/MocA family oxidoreductase [Candidatus Acidiferrum sp.]
MARAFFLGLVGFFLIVMPRAGAQSSAPAGNASAAPLRVAMAGLAHGHADGFLTRTKERHDIQIVGIAEPDRKIFDRYAAKFALDTNLYHADLDEMLTATHPQAVLVYTNTYDHRRAVEICAKHAVPVMMEKPLAVSNADARAIERAARAGKIAVLVNYETTWYRSNHAVYDLVHQNAIGEICKVVVHDGHQGPAKINVQPEFLAWLNDPKLGGDGALFDFGCYGADLMTWLMDGHRPDSVTAVTQHFQPSVYPSVDDEATVILTYPKAQAILQASWNWPFDRKDMEVYGETGYAITMKRDDLRLRLPKKDAEELVPAKPVPAPLDDSISYLRAVVLDGLKPEGPSSLETNLVVTEILDAAHQSATSGKTIHLKAKKEN